MDETDEPRQSPGLTYVAEPALDAELIRSRYQRLLDRLRRAAEEGGHDPNAFRVVAITKTWPVGVARAALTAGISALGESRVQEAEPKVAAVPDAEWHLVGRLQSNKARRAVRLFAVIHSIDGARRLEIVDAAAQQEGTRPRVMIQVNATGDPAKAGVDPDRLVRDLTPAMAEVRHVDVVGLMTIGREGAAFDDARAAFRRLGVLRDALQEAIGAALPELSMGMSADAEAAVAEGATLVRIGTALFGPR